MAIESSSTLLPVVVGGLLALAGGIIGSAATVLNTWHQSSLEKTKRRAENFQELVTAVYEFDHWLDTKQDIQVHHNEATPLGISPLASLEGLSAVYFPSFLSRVLALKNSATYFQTWIGNAAMRRARGDMEHVNDGLQEAYGPYVDAREALLSDLIDYAKKEFPTSQSSSWLRLNPFASSFRNKNGNAPSA
jgi:hypothetical protein